ncbi:NFX1-type zinc finger-containing protein 1-like isoform X2 [Anthonomus grandis grandis]|uniref:NFX1-type zinc finger-containing protein 1-like isoform X2 n=1 Tax=Anthonomus grandis grandis TaxID=2921223 RepID=UPI0021669C8F|nr:NFX1-type zinc finger-containing protein 1-like isoform X2 [Anthonomus grandis grandis]
MPTSNMGDEKDKKKDRRAYNWRSRDIGPSVDTNKYFTTRSGTSRPYGNSRGRCSPYQSNQRLKFTKSLDNNIQHEFLDSKFLTDMLQKDIETISYYIIHNAPTFLKVISDLPLEILILITKMTAKACGNESVTSRCFILRSFLKEKLVTVLCTFLSSLLTNDSVDKTFWDDIKEVLGCILTILEGNLQLLPSSSWEQVQTVTKNLSLVLPVLHNTKPIICDNLNQRVVSLQTDLVTIENKFKKNENHVLAKNNNQSEEVPEDDFRSSPVFPSVSELIIPERPPLRRNVVKGKFSSVKDYLDIHYRLLREDFVNPIREDICDFLNRSQKHLFNIKIHRNVNFLYKTIVKGAVYHKIKFEISEALKNILRSGENKRFMHGTLLLFSCNNFKSLICGKVCANKDLERGYLDVHSDDYVDFDATYTMIECVLFFEPYYQVLRILQRLPHDTLPMERYLVNVDRHVLNPKYLNNIRRYDLPQKLNQSQRAALHAAMNKEMVIIQGPPGTGKTFLGLELVKMLLELKPQWTCRGPIVIITYTNHALDQFLNEIRSATDKVIRFGRNSTDIMKMENKYGVENKLKHIFGETYLCNRGILRELASHFNSDGSKRIPNSRLISIQIRRRCSIDIDLDKIPIDLRLWLKEKVALWESSRFLAAFEERFFEEETTLSFLIKHKETTVISPEKFCSGVPDNLIETIIPYYFENFDFFFWLLYDDGSIAINKRTDKKIAAVDNDEEEELYYFLSNYALDYMDILNDRDEEDTFLQSCQFKDTLEYIKLSDLIKKGQDFERIIENQESISHIPALRSQIEYIKQKVQYIQFCLETDFGTPEDSLSEQTDPFSLPSRARWQLYKDWINRCMILLRKRSDRGMWDHLEQLFDEHTSLKNINTAYLCKSMDIIAMTTARAARSRELLERIESPILIVEEAAEVLESHVITALTKHCQHLILLGDHLQLRPSTSDYLMQRKYDLGVSLFERLIENGVECHTLNVQHRMRPEISSLIHPLIYKTLINHVDVTNYPKVKGMTHSLYFIDHMEPEESYGDSSKMNTHEVKFLIGLAIYLLQNGYKPENITILSTYRGQMYALKKQQSNCALQEVKKIRIAVVDDFQGEENKIILLSLVRSNPEGNIGFLSTENRVCVALSRAKEGLYIIGNMTQLCGASDVWKSIKTTLQSQNAISTFLPLRCNKHDEHVTFVSKDTDFLKVPEGGCNQSCNSLLDCGHRCIKICHIADADHILYKCTEKCTRSLCLDVTHKCKKLCFEECGSCYYTVLREFPCGHSKKLPCNVTNYKCMESKEIQPECGHVQNIYCYQNTGEFLCEVGVERTMPICGHVQVVQCHMNIAEFKCKFETELTLECGHNVKKICSKGKNEEDTKSTATNNKSYDLPCNIMIEKMIPACGHVQMLPCYQRPEDVKCQFVVEGTLRCGHKRNYPCADKQNIECVEKCQKPLKGCKDPKLHGKCPRPCGKKCSSCTKMAIQRYDNCRHFENVPCIKLNPFKKCDKPCGRKLSCGHKCQLKCYEPCIKKCKQYVVKILPECGHKQKLMCSETPSQLLCSQPCSKIMKCGHKCLSTCNKPCSNVCSQRCSKLLDCTHTCIQRCDEKCACKTFTFVDCGHRIAVKCNEDIDKKKCEDNSIKRLPCGHRKWLPCSADPALEVCNQKCEALLPCGHSCSQPCKSQCSHAKKCQKKCLKTLRCGHLCKNLCGEPCTKKCLSQCSKKLICGHNNICSQVCSAPCVTFEKCGSKCDKILSCGHQCINMCGEECVCKIVLSTDCEHFVRVKCEVQPTKKYCEQKCEKKLNCGHYCKQKCKEDCFCFEVCEKQLKCGCSCIKQYCSDTCECRNRCLLNDVEEDDLHI